MYKLEPDLMNPGLHYIYEDTIDELKLVLSVYRNLPLAKHLVNYLNGVLPLEYKESINE